MNKLLLIDDDVNLCKVMEYQLQKNGFDVTTANDGPVGMEYFRKQDFDIVITDIQMPGMSGIEV
ncbi:MAG: response regulator, partial [Calditrichia bacterium]